MPGYLPLKDIFLALMVIALWSGNYAVSAVVLRDIPPLLYTALRFALTALLLLPWLSKITHSQLQKIFGLAVVLAGVHMAGLLVAIQLGLDITTCALVAQLGVPFSCMLGVFFLGERIGKWRLLGLMLAFTGTVVVLDSPHLKGSETGFAVGLLAAFAWAVSNLQLKQLKEMPMIHTIAWLSVISAPLLAVVSYFVEGDPRPIIETAPIVAGLGLLYSSLFSTIVGYGYWTVLVKRHPVSRVAPFVLLIPIFSGALGVTLLGDPLTHELLIGGALTLSGIALIVLRKPTTAV